MLSSAKPKVMVGLSGGVDSSVALLLLQQQGYAVEAMFMKNWEEEDQEGHCLAARDALDAEAVCERLQVPFHRVNFSQYYWERVFENFLQGSAAGLTPNPDILCNKEIKFNAFLDYARKQGADKIATGHYAAVVEQNDTFHLSIPADAAKDQTYFLYTLSQQQLKQSLFPLAHLRKSEVRALAKENGLVTHNKKDSTGICFIGERKFKDFLAQYLRPKPGMIEADTGEVLGEHDGLMYYTIGQRQGLGIGGIKNKEGAWYVVHKDLARNVLIVAQGEHHPLLYHQSLIAREVHWISGHPPSFPSLCQAKIRYRQNQEDCRVELIAEDKIKVDFLQPQRAITLGQSVVFYHQNFCLGGGIIEAYA